MDESAQPTAVRQDLDRDRVGYFNESTSSGSSSCLEQDDQFHVFLTGIVLGAAGGALIGLLGELVAPFNRRRDESESRS